MQTKNPAGPPPSGADAPVRVGSPDPAPNPSKPERSEQVSRPGPKTPEGKSISSRNSTTHGLRATKIDNAVAPAMRAKYEKLRQQYLDDYRPAGAIESTLVDMVIFAAWQLYKVREMELFTGLDLGMTGSFGRSEKLARYRGSHERLFFRSLNQLRQIQQERALLAADKTAALPTHIPPAVRLKPLFTHLKTLHRHPKTLTASATAPQSRIALANQLRKQRAPSPSGRLRTTRF